VPLQREDTTLEVKGDIRGLRGDLDKLMDKDKNPDDSPKDDAASGQGQGDQN
jgi:hypothetical protein